MTLSIRKADDDREDMISIWQSLTQAQQQFAIGVLMSKNPEAFRDAMEFTKAKT